MLEIDQSAYGFKWKTIWFYDHPYDVKGYDSVNFYQCSQDVEADGFSKQEFSTIVIDLTLDEDELWKNMGRSSCRSAINKARNSGVTIKINEGYEEFYALNSNFRKYKGLPRYNLSIEYMKNYCTLFISEYEGDILGGLLYLNDRDYFRGLLGASKRLDDCYNLKKNLIGNANKMIIWNAMLHAKSCGKRFFDMGGYSTEKVTDEEMEGINRFKKSFGGDLVTYYHYQKDYSKIFSLAKKVYESFN
ncbi:hypothetical protein [Methanogenium organophilum]|uniref:BioF2-like acetyltransferase domain-containing protein n=1 Tax=Methanogenium organophilum TaxID=2199 RepID=A0A9X9S4A1_METOG|nr:hypothetical protein [Methanogenium organophilum]WAI01213.1 hypothetical protein OU421_12490 [Methanogenium organophilum]